MKLIKQSHEILHITPNALELLEVAGRTCYKSEGKIGPGTACPFVKRRIETHHESVIEHASMTVRFVTNRGVTHELVRHRLGSYSQESTRYVNYGGKEMEFIEPVWESTPAQADLFVAACRTSETWYLNALTLGWTPQQAREVLPNALRAEIVMTANFREWRHVFKERTSKAAHPQMRALMIGLLAEVKTRVPVIFDDILVEEVAS